MSQLSKFAATLFLLIAFAQPVGSAELNFIADSSCLETTVNEIECNERIARRYEAQIEKDFRFLTSRSSVRNSKSAIFFRLGQIAFKNYLQHNCESERHDVFGGTLEDVIEQKCRRDLMFDRRKLFVSIAERDSKGPDVEVFAGRPICNAFADPSKPVQLMTNVVSQETESLRRLLDQTAARTSASGHNRTSLAKLFRSVHIDAEKQNAFDANFTCLAIYEGFCQNHPSTRLELEASLRDQWLSRCQTQIRGAFYKRTLNRLRTLRSQ